MTQIDVTAAVPATATLADPEVFLPAPARPAGPWRWLVDFVVGPMRHRGLVTLGPVWRTDGREGRSIRWSPARDAHDALPYDALMPEVHGVLVLEEGELGLHVHYTPGAGVVGRGLDVLLRPVARASIRRFVRDVARRLQGSVPAGAGGH